MTSQEHRRAKKREQSPAAKKNPKNEVPSSPDRRDEVGATSGIPIVGLGGSAGSLESFKDFFAGMPADSGAAFVIIQHLAPAHRSLLAEILAQHTRMPVCEAREGMPVEENSVYVIPPNRYLGIRDGVLHLAEPVTEHGIRLPIDFFFRSLAEDRQERAICILFSGAGSDGALGIRAVRGAGGLTIAQDQTAQFREMPHSAVATGMVDLVLRPDQMPQEVSKYLQQPFIRGGEPAAVVEAEGAHDGLNDTLELVRAQTGSDFRCYKKSTILRRISRRMRLHGISDISQYNGLLRQDDGEISRLYKDLLINVTAFFRDAEAFEELRRVAITPLVGAKQANDQVRVWVPGCSSGEEAYSIAMLLREQMDAAQKNCELQVFATDIDDAALQVARTGIYPESIVADVGTDRISRFFTRKDGGYEIIESLRAPTVFAVQNLIGDPPFSKIDIISCRNLLIYLDAETQARLIPLFNFALVPGGYLFLGKSEGVGRQQELFQTVSAKFKLYRRLTPARPVAVDFPISSGRKKAMPGTSPTEARISAASYADSVRQALMEHFAASIVLIDRKGQVLQFHGQTVKYLNLPTGDPGLNLLEMAREGLSIKIRSALHEAGSEGKAVVMDNVQFNQNGGAAFARVTVAPIAGHSGAEPLFAVIFEDVVRPVTAQPAREGEDEIVKRLENELRATRRDLLAAIEELKGANEDLRIANEEVISTNEELQSTNEELETSKEELQSVNEELTTVNSQLQDKVESLNAANRDILNFLKSTQVATLFLDGELRIKMFTPATTRLFNLIPSDMGRPIRDLSMNFIGYDLVADARAVASSAEHLVEREVQHTSGSFYLLRVMPYRTERDQIDGVVVTFGDVTKIRRAEKEVRRLATAVKDSNDAVILFDLDGNIQAWNRGAREIYGWSETEALKMNFRDLVPADKTTEILDLMKRLLSGELIPSFEAQRLTRNGKVLDVWLTISVVLDEAGKVEAFASTERDITDRKQREKELKTLNETLEQRVSQLRRLASELTVSEQRERQRLALILHDGLQQILVGAKYQLALVARNQDVQGASAKIGDLIDEAIEASRSLTAQLSPPILSQGGLIAGMEWLARWMHDKHGLSVDLTVRESIESPPQNLTVFLFHATRELLFNIIKHSEVMAARVEVARFDGEIQIEVADEGVGFDPSKLESTEDLRSIGLFGIRERLRMLGGRLEIDSSPGNGCRLKLIAPYSVQTAEALADPGQPTVSVLIREGGKREVGATRKIRIIMVDDHIIVRQGLAGLLRAEQDMELVGEASDGAAAVKLVREIRPDVVLMDISMPGMNGVEATRIIHREFPDIRVIGLSMFQEGEQAEALREAGAVGYVTKSGSTEAVLAVIRSCCPK